VVNAYLQRLQAPSLFILGASTFPNSASANPTPTILALTYRTADAIVHRGPVFEKTGIAGVDISPTRWALDNHTLFHHADGGWTIPGKDNCSPLGCTASL
jgi:hypothetical protein